MSAAYHCFPSKKDAANAIVALETWYGEGIKFRKGILNFVLTLATIPFFFILYFVALLMGFFSTVYGFGIVWFVILFFISGKFLI